MNPGKLTQLKAQVRRLDSISTAPAILQPLLEMLRVPSDNVSLEKVVKLTSYDGAIAAQCLRLANSPFSDAARLIRCGPRSWPSVLTVFAPCSSACA
jgi:HD-like signal output (HDOD) protein